MHSVQRLPFVLCLAGLIGCMDETSTPSPDPVAVDQPDQQQPMSEFVATLTQVEDVPDGRYSMWWSKDNADSFVDSPCHAALERIYKFADGIETRLLGTLLSGIDAIEPHVDRIQYLDESLTVYLNGPEANPVVLTVSQEKGIRFHFHETTCKAEYRDEFLQRYADYVAAIRTEVEENGSALDPEWDPRALEWWQLSINAMNQMEDVESFGAIVIESTPN